MKRKIMLVVKPPTEADRLDELRSAVAGARARGHRVRVRLTFEAGDARRYARAAALGGCEVVVAAGGDGTVNEVVNGLAAVPDPPALAILPLGTANDFAAGFGLPDDAEAALRVAVDGRAHRVDLARVNRRYFINVSTGGFGADATRDAGARAKRWLGRLAYLVSGARHLVDFEAGGGEFRVDGETVFDGSFILFAVGNGWRTGGGTRITPYADAGDGWLDLVLVRGSRRRDLLAILPELRTGRHLEHPDVLHFRGRRVEVAAEERISVNADGEPIAGTRFRYDLIPGALRLMLE